MKKIRIAITSGTFFVLASFLRESLTSPALPQVQVRGLQIGKFQRWSRPSLARQQGVVGLKILHSFAGFPHDAAEPMGLIDVNGELYGAAGGGTGDVGAIFSIGLTGSEHVVYNFPDPTKGAASGPVGPLIYENGFLYGTSGGGASLIGAVYRVSLAGTENLIYSFKNAKSDGFAAEFGVIDVGGTLYGTTLLGGSNGGGGVIFRITAAGKESLISSFPLTANGAPDGIEPERLMDVGNMLYGINAQGGLEPCFCGTVFKTSLTGPAIPIFKFNGTDGAGPSGGLIYDNGYFYGVTQEGGDTSCIVGCGVVFKVSPSGAESTVYRFKGGDDGSDPSGPLLVVNGVLYGVTESGGGTARVCPGGCGTIFKMTTSGVETVLYRFKGGAEGYGPVAPLIDVNGFLYGAFGAGGKYGHGAVFELSQ